jgi:hypothetical protein
MKERHLGAITKRAILGDGKGKTLFERMTEGKEPRIDEDLPFGIKIGGMIEIDIPKSSYVLVRNDLVMQKPAKRGTVFSIGEIDFGGGLKIIRVYYSKSVDEPEDVAGVAFLQIEMQGTKVLQTKIYTLNVEFDLTEDDSDAVFDNGDGTFSASIPNWLNSEQPILGAPEFYVPNENDDEDQWVYSRVSKPNLMEQVVEEREEILYDSSFKRSAITMKLTTAEYSRAFENEKAFDGRELCIVRLNETDDDATIEVYLGISVEKSKISSL